jgi:hypothetical protein
MVINMVLNNLLVSLAYDLLWNFFMNHNIYIYRSCMHDMYAYFNQILIY